MPEQQPLFQAVDTLDMSYKAGGCIKQGSASSRGVHEAGRCCWQLDVRRFLGMLRMWVCHALSIAFSFAQCLQQRILPVGVAFESARNGWCQSSSQCFKLLTLLTCHIKHGHASSRGMLLESQCETFSGIECVWGMLRMWLCHA